MKTKIFSLVILAAGLSFSAFAGTPKGESKSDVKDGAEMKAAPSETTTGDVALYWFETNTAGNALLDPDGIDENEAPATLGPCHGSQADYCARGFTEAQTTVDANGMRTPNVSITAGQPDKKQP